MKQGGAEEETGWERTESHSAVSEREAVRWQTSSPAALQGRKTAHITPGYLFVILLPLENDLDTT